MPSGRFVEGKQVGNLLRSIVSDGQKNLLRNEREDHGGFRVFLDLVEIKSPRTSGLFLGEFHELRLANLIHEALAIKNPAIGVGALGQVLGKAGGLGHLGQTTRGGRRIAPDVRGLGCDLLVTTASRRSVDLFLFLSTGYEGKSPQNSEQRENLQAFLMHWLIMCSNATLSNYI